ncbi:PD-(D/E)XK nuclease family protein [Bacillus sp. S13(2024)]|uniref:PD-(D/E)XK nuclease family protein n=1 Tax=Bacillus sp. S13(2024) TaxID=3162885 RepID=UPI003D212E24
MDAKQKLDELYKQGARVFSHSKLGTYNNCEYEYYNIYVLKNRGINNIYTELGSCLHNNIEAIYANESDIERFKENYTNKLFELEMMDIKFPSESIGNSWKTDVDHFLNNFNKMETKIVQEKLIVFEITDGIWLQGYIDGVLPSEKGKPFVNILDWKTSSKFSGKKLTEAGRQLLMYKVGLEDNTTFKVDKIMWFMIKYIYVCNMQKNGKVKKKMCNRGKWVKEIKSQIEKELNKLNIDEFELELLLDKATEDNNLDCLPKEIQEKYWLEDCFVEYDITDEKIEELKQYIIETINKIDSKDHNDENDWKPVEIDKYNSFYCATLCGHRKTCKFYKKFLEGNADNFGKKDKKDDFDIFG